MEKDENPFISNVKYSKEYKLASPKTPKNDRFISAGERRIREALFRDSLRETNSEASTPTKPLYKNVMLTPSSKRKSISTTPIKQTQRMISKTPEMILEAPGARDDYYCSLLDWSSRDQIVIALDQKCILKKKSEIIHLYDAPEYINTCKFSPSGTSLGVASENSMVIQDLETSKINTYHHENGVSTLIFKNENEFVCGDNLGDLHFWDRRKNHSNSLLGFHRDRVVGMCVQKSLLATGGNGNFINIWDERRQDKPVFTFKEHTSATRALTFCPFRDIIASGGGLDDYTIKLHSINTGRAQLT
jgi:WD40 repeat protein